MNSTFNQLISRNSVFAWIAVAVGVLLLVPLGAMQFNETVNWSVADFVVMGVLLFAAGSAFVFVARRVSSRQWLMVGAVVLAVFLYVWAELAVGVFTHLGS